MLVTIGVLIYPKIIIPNKEIAEELFSQLQKKYSDAKYYYSKVTQGYFTGSHKDLFVAKYNSVQNLWNTILSKRYKKYLKAENYAPIVKWINDYSNIDTIRKEHNKRFIENELETHKDFFDNVVKYPLDYQQRRSIVTLEDATLVVSAAGGGKSTTMVGKVRYLVDKLNIDPKNILIITYTRKAAQELTEKLGHSSYVCRTINKTAFDIVTEVENGRPDMAEASIFPIVFQYLLDNNHEFKHNIVEYLLNYQSLQKTEHEYESAQDYYTDRQTYGIQANVRDMDGNIIFTRSEDEKRICTILYRNGIKFRYEEPYEKDTRDLEHRQYKPDFSIYYTDKNNQCQRIYLEHFGINKYGKIASWMTDNIDNTWATANRKYHEGITWKRQTHAKYNTTLIETTSAMVHDGTIEEELLRQLRSNGVPINPIPDDLLYQSIAASKKVKETLLKLLESFTNLLKSNLLDIDAVVKKMKENKDSRSIFIVNSIMRPFIEKYQQELQRLNQLDFTDVILKTTEYCKAGLYKPSYQYILVDEFQDISRDKCNFINALRRKEPLTQLFCVGDDWQSIYRFAGSDMELFSQFSKYFGHTANCKIETTYRFCKPLLSHSSSFILKNPNQVTKTVREGRKKQTSFELKACDSNGVNELCEIVGSVPQDKSIMILGRYSFTKDDVIDNINVKETIFSDGNVTLNINGRDCKYLTVHKSKGLEADVVILLSCNSGNYGFPSVIADDPVLGYLLSKADQFKFGEERRVFYVAITRAINNMYVLYNKNKPSPFVSECEDILGLAKFQDISRCPKCGVGHLQFVRQGTAKNGNTYFMYRCDNNMAGCDYVEFDFDNDFIPLQTTIFKHKK